MNKSIITVVERELYGITIKVRADLASYDGLHWDLIMNSKQGTSVSHRVILTVRGINQLFQILDLFLTTQYLEQIISYQEKLDLYADIRNTMLSVDF